MNSDVEARLASIRSQNAPYSDERALNTLWLIEQVRSQMQRADELDNARLMLIEEVNTIAGQLVAAEAEATALREALITIQNRTSYLMEWQNPAMNDFVRAALAGKQGEQS